MEFVVGLLVLIVIESLVLRVWCWESWCGWIDVVGWRVAEVGCLYRRRSGGEVD